MERMGEVRGAREECDERLCFLDAYDYDLPEDLIAQTPAPVRDGSRLMCVCRGTGAARHRVFADLAEILRPGDLLVMNDTRVLHARTTGEKIPGGAGVEIFFLRPAGDPQCWEALVRPGKKLQPGTRVALDGGCTVEIAARTEDGGRVVRLPEGMDAETFFARCGRVPLPHYIKETTGDDGRYQTVYADRSKTRSVAAPTAGLHFTAPLFARLEARGVERAFLTLDVGVGTFRPVKAADVRAHRMHTERCEVTAELADRLNHAKAEGRRIVAVGTTSVRTLESFADTGGHLSCGARETDIFIRPGYSFRFVDAMITNFHLPKSTLLMLVAAFAGYETAMTAYREAVRERYRFFSFGDSMLIE